MITCTFENGNAGGLRHVCANVIVVNQARDSVLLTKRAPGMVGGNTWCMPGGYMERDHRVIETAVREVLEETGYDVTLEGLVGVTDLPERGDNGRQNIVFVFAGVAGEKKQDADQESTAQTWFKFTELPPPEEWAFDHQVIVARYLNHGALLPFEKIFLGGAI